MPFLSRAPRWLPVLLLAGVVLLLAGCGGGAGTDEPGLGTVALRNETDQGMAPQVVTAFWLVPAGSGDPGPNRLAQDLEPGGVVILGLFPAGTYDAIARLASGFDVQFQGHVVVAGEATTFVVPGGS